MITSSLLLALGARPTEGEGEFLVEARRQDRQIQLSWRHHRTQDETKVLSDVIKIFRDALVVSDGITINESINGSVQDLNQ